MSKAVSESAQILRRRLSELDAERDQILVALQALDRVAGNGASAAKPRQRRRRTTAAPASKPVAARTAGRQRGSRAGQSRRSANGTQADRLLKLVSETPGITVAQAAAKMGMSRPNALYSVASRLAKEGKVTKQGTGYRAA